MIGLDYASVDENKPPNFAAAYTAGARWVQIRGAFDSGHKEIVDPNWARDHTAAKAAGLKVGPYLFPGWDVGDPPPEEQVAVFAAAVGNPERGVDLVPALDIEFSKGISGTGHSRAELMALIRRFIAALRTTYGVWPELYMSGRVWNTDDTDTLGNPPATDLVDCSPWVAHYAYARGIPPVYNPPTTPPPAPNAWGFFWKHQYQGDTKGFPGFSSTVDLSRFINMLPGETSPRVMWVTRRVKAYAASRIPPGVSVENLSLPINNVYDRVAVAGVQMFQRANGLVDDGIVGLDTHTKLCWINP